jgi:peptidoglycan hydrolase-like protein with peptidoglycan-binding domain
MRADEMVHALEEAESDEEARRVEASFLEQTDNGLRPGDPVDQPSQQPTQLHALGGGDVARVIARFESQLGTTESPPGSNRTPYTDWYGMTGPWCAMFVSWCFFHEGIPLPASTPKGFASTPVGAQWFKSQGRWTETPGRGHVVFFDFPNDNVNRISHVGIVVGVNGDGSIDTIEGNTDERGGRTGGKVMRRRRAVGIVGYGVPPYEDSSDSGDTPGDDGRPAWNHPHGGVIRAPHHDCGTVRQWQQRMADLGRQIVVDADYGPASRAVCCAFQREKGLEVDGIVGPKTWAATWE